jgi:hypothetical protein
MERAMRRSYWIYSIGLAIAWVIVLILRFILAGPQAEDIVLYLFAGFAIAWIAETIARSVYPPPRRWTRAARPAAEDQRPRVMLNYWTYSIGLAVVWAILLGGMAAAGALTAPVLWLFAGFAICWISGTIARYVYPPPAKWTAPAHA